MNIFLKIILLCVVIGILAPLGYFFFAWLWKVNMDEFGIAHYLFKSLLGIAGAAFGLFVLDKAVGW